MTRIFSVISLVTFISLFNVSQVFAEDPRIEQAARFAAKGEYEKALGEYRSLLADNPKNSDVYYLAAQTRMKMNDYGGALANFRLAYRYTPTMSEAYEGAAKVYEALGQKSKAEAERAKDPKNAPVIEEPTPVENIAEPIKEPVQEDPKNIPEPAKPEPIKKANTPEPEKNFETAQSSNVGISDDPFEKGVELFKAGKYEEAAPFWREVLSKKPGDAGAYFYAGLTRFELGEYDKAEYNLKRGLTYKVRGNEANYYLALVYQKMNRKDSEKRYLQAYLKKASPSSPLRSSAEALLAELNGSVVPENANKVETPAITENVEKAEKAAIQKDEVKNESVKEPKSSEKEVIAKASEKKSNVDVDNGAPSIDIANKLLKARNYEPALKMYKELLETDLEPEQRYFAMLQMGNIYRELRDYHSAVNRYRVIVQEFPDSDWATEAERAQLEAIWQEKHANEFPRKKR